MPRKRMIDPGIWQSEQVGSVTRDERLLFIGIFSNADDDGRLKGSGAYLRAVIFPYDETVTAKQVANWRDHLVKVGLIRHYVVEGSEYIDLPNWTKYQRIDKPTASLLPPFDEESTTSQGVLGEESVTSPSEVKRSKEKRSICGDGDGAGAPADTPKSAQLDEARELFAYYREHIQPKAERYTKKKLLAMIKAFGLEKCKLAIDHFSADHWEMDNNAHRGADWFFAKEQRIEAYINMRPRSRPEPDHSNGSAYRRPADPVPPPPVDQVLPAWMRTRADA